MRKLLVVSLVLTVVLAWAAPQMAQAVEVQAGIQAVNGGRQAFPMGHRG